MHQKDFDPQRKTQNLEQQMALGSTQEGKNDNALSELLTAKTTSKSPAKPLFAVSH